MASKQAVLNSFDLFIAMPGRQIFAALPARARLKEIEMTSRVLRLSALFLASFLQLASFAIASAATSSSFDQMRSAIQTSPEKISPEQRARVQVLFAKFQRLGQQALKLENYDAALGFYSEALEEAAFLREQSPALLRTLDSLALIYEKTGRAEESLKVQEKALLLRQDIGLNEPTSMLDAYIRLARTSDAMGDRNRSDSYFKKALVLARSAGVDLQTRPELMEMALNESLSSGNFAEAKVLLNKLIALDDKSLPDEISAGHRERLAAISWRQGNLKDALANLKVAMKIRSSCQSQNDPEYIALLRNLLRAKLTLGDMNSVEDSLPTLLAFDREALGLNTSDQNFDKQLQAELCFKQGKTAQSRQLISQVIQAQTDLSSMEAADAYTLLAQISAADRQWHEAKLLAENALEIRRSHSLPEVFSVNDYETLSRVYRAWEEKPEAVGFLLRALALRQEQFKDDYLSINRINAALAELKPAAFNETAGKDAVFEASFASPK
ncbi:MAG: tetratricopeptide repeat protein [Candidatus Obscuribacterales bacterium]|nr:tetratricopeptide repeat protein [Candidatus Obscuribacterales bacterium]